ncbi:hypothetical protein BDV10DRAFT_190462, partial [Aspergillus recurvatus]
MATSAPQTPIRNRSNNLTSPPSPPGLTPTIVSAKSKRRRHRHRRRERQRALQARLLAALPEHLAPAARAEDDKLPDSIANPAADTVDNNDNGNNGDNVSGHSDHGDHGNNVRDHGDLGDQGNNVRDHGDLGDHGNNTSDNSDYGDHDSDHEDTSTPITGIGLRPIEKTVAVVINNASKRKRRHTPSRDPNHDSNSTAPTTRAKRARATLSRSPMAKGSMQAAARVRDPDPVVAAQPCVRCVKNMFILDKVTGKVVGPAVCMLKQHRAKRCTRCAEGNKKCVPLPAALVGRALALAKMRRTREAAHQTIEFRFEIDAELKKAHEREK